MIMNLPNIGAAMRKDGLMISNKTQAKVDRWEARTHVFVVFAKDYVDIQGEFEDDELSEIASIQRQRLKELKPVRKSQQKGLFDDDD